ncbi:hypothetical protein [Zoogloea dura]|jgi:hypothetical protein|uniref:Uncharacterized protein n=1 Tax=Zoogloea dura TaxID=2728840 RepID=A0A848G2W8_9RHOO|nr:hypothetical protein [Zoogloea dura]NML25562.1 hypothetical protein [Zoogloea dura]
MNMHLFALIGLLALAVLAWQAWRERAGARSRIPAVWEESLQRIAMDQRKGHHRVVRECILQACRRLELHPELSGNAPHIRVRLAVMLGEDPVYPVVLRSIRAASASEEGVSEMALCIALRQFLVEDIRTCMALAECFGQVRRLCEGGDCRVEANFIRSV